MNAIPLVAGSGAAPEALPRPLQQAAEELARLVEAPAAPAAFYAEYLRHVQEALGGMSAALWTRERDSFRLDQHSNFAATGLDDTPHGLDCHVEILRRVARRDRPVWLPPGAADEKVDERIGPRNVSPLGALLAPIVLDGDTVGVVEVWLPDSLDAPSRETGAQFLTIAAGLAAAYQHRAAFQQLQDQTQARDESDAFTRAVHGSLDAREVAYLVANQGRHLLGCDQIAVALRVGQQLHVEAISGATTVEARSPLVQALRQLCERVVTWGEKVVYAGRRDESLPPDIVKALDGYLARSNSRLLIVLPLRDQRAQDAQAPARVALVVENFAALASPAEVEQRLQQLAPASAAALHNAIAYRRATSGWFTRARHAVEDWTHGRRGRMLLLVAAALALIAALLTFIPAPLRLEARGQLLPRERQIVYATRAGKVVELKTHHGDPVQKGQELLYLEDLETQLKVDQLNVKVAFAEQRLAALGDQLGKATANEERNALLREQIQQQYELRKAAVERDILLQESRSPRRAPVAAPLAGKVVTFDAREQLVGKTVKPGDPLLRIARVQGAWEVELLVGEKNLAAIRAALQRAGDAGVPVHLLLASQPLRTYQGRLRWDGLGGETTVKDQAVMLPIKVEIVDRELLEQLPALPVGLDVRARIDCGQRALGFVWFGDLLEFIYERTLF